MKLDEIGKQIEVSQMTEVLQTLRFQVKRSFALLDKQGQVNQSAEFKNQYLEIKKGQVTLTSRPQQDLAGLNLDMALQSQALKQVLPSGYYPWPWSSSPIVRGVDAKNQIFIQLPEELLLNLYSEKFVQSKVAYTDFRNQVYLKLARQFINYQWVLTYFFGATPFKWEEMVAEAKVSPVRSHRTSLNAVELKEANIIDYRDLAKYQAIQNTGVDFVSLMTEELADQTRVISGLQLNQIDLAPQTDFGQTKELLPLINVMAGYFLMTAGPEIANLRATLTAARQKNQIIAQENPFAQSQFATELRQFLDELGRFAKNYRYNDFSNVIAVLKQRLDKPEETLAARSLRQNQGMSVLATSLANLDYRTTEIKLKTLSHNSLLLLQRAVLKGLDYQVIAPEADIIEIAGHLIDHGISQSQNSLLYSRLWAQKQTAKKLAQAAGVTTSSAWVVKNNHDLSQLWPLLQTKGLVLKPAGEISSNQNRVFRMPPTSGELKIALGRLQKDSKEVLIEQVVAGSNYRALIIAGKLVSLIERLPLRVVGDGRTPLADLLVRKNIKLGQIEKETLKSQGIRLTDVISRGIEVLLRYDASSQTGMQSYESLTEMDASYRPVIENLAAKLGMVEGALDLVIPNIYQVYDAQKDNQLVFLSAHCYPELAFHQKTVFGDQDIVTEIFRLWNLSH
ncbi:MAG: bifunctional glutamate--cysteine ligase/glutathione synthetase [Ligilactobacillus sp.]|nr:bifunctional glutamate--cysteine ligase/glutathione synthetase [Ligilactobacillus sp.]